MLLAPFEETIVPHWLPLRPRLRAHWRLLMTGRTDVTKMPWGTTGPRGLTTAIHAAGIDVDPLPPSILYPVPWQDAEWVADPTQRYERRISAQTVSIHLWNERIKHLKERPAQRGSFLAQLQEEGR